MVKITQSYSQMWARFIAHVAHLSKTESFRISKILARSDYIGFLR